jgi:hypothetical protein
MEPRYAIFGEMAGLGWARLPDHSRLRFVEHVEEDRNAQACQQMD